MGNLIDLTYEIQDRENEKIIRAIKEIPLREKTYRGLIYQYHLSSMDGTYIDLPGHIAEFDDGFDMAKYPLEKLFMVDTLFIRLKRERAERKITAEELETACPSMEKPFSALCIHALGDKNFYDYSQATIPYYQKDAVEWIIRKNIHLFISDVYENHHEPEGIFMELFKNSISTVCHPVNLQEIKNDFIKITALPVRAKGATQIPCRLIASL
ncbi:MAG: hypothetical protein DDT31_01107 [Syntrophomonadaceae bacterium]|nr:hypothetical protein [Bacillota bacterium]